MAVDVAFVWHMHQPYYRLPGQEHFFLPWVRLHAVKAYHDMAYALGRHPDVRATVNFSGALCEQLLDYVEGGRRDLWWHLTEVPADDLTAEQRAFILEHFFSLHWDRLVRPHPRYAELLERRQRTGSDPAAFTVDELRDLQVLFNLQWCGFALRDNDPEVARLVARGRGFSESDKHALLAVHGRTLSRIGPMWRELAERGQVELSATPLYHPILPLLIDSDCARIALPDHPLPPRFQAPRDAELHVRSGLDASERLFGIRPTGMWPAEGSVSPGAAEVFAAAGVSWIATDEHVLKRSTGPGVAHPSSHFDHWQVQTAHGSLPILFRDHELSDLIGFSYARNDAGAAAGDLVERIRGVERRAACAAPCAVVILDGENPWEAYANDGGAFLDALYTRLAASDVRTVTPSMLVAHHRGQRRTVQHLHSGSWIDASFRIWIGVDAKNRGWELLGEARATLAEAVRARGADEPSVVAARQALMRAEGSDWFWWYGDDFTSANDAQFDELFRSWCAAVFMELELPVPHSMSVPIGRPTTHREAVRPERWIRPRIDGRLTSYFEWEGAGRIAAHGPGGAMASSRAVVAAVRYGFDAAHLFVRVDPTEEMPADAEVLVSLDVAGAEHSITALRASEGEGAIGSWAWEQVIEVKVALEAVGLAAGEAFGLRVVVRETGVQTAAIPASGPASVRVMGARETALDWIV